MFKGILAAALVFVSLSATAAITTNDQLMEAVAKGEVKKVESILKKDPKQANVNLNSIQETPLTLAALNGHSAVIELLIKNGAEVNHQMTNGWSALMFAARGTCFKETCDGTHATKDFADSVKVLLKHGADKALKNSDGDTALSLATKSGNTDIVQILK